MAGFERPFEVDGKAADTAATLDFPFLRRRDETSLMGAGKIGRRTESRDRPDFRAERAPAASK
jgi:hypothetical protein